jgi:hypothetical protein
VFDAPPCWTSDTCIVKEVQQRLKNFILFFHYNHHVQLQHVCIDNQKEGKEEKKMWMQNQNLIELSSFYCYYSFKDIYCYKQMINLYIVKERKMWKYKSF